MIPTYAVTLSFIGLTGMFFAGLLRGSIIFPELVFSLFFISIGIFIIGIIIVLKHFPEPENTSHNSKSVEGKTND